MAYIGDYIKESINEGVFLRNVIYISGCRHRCKNCFSSQTWDFNYGIPFTEKVQEKVIKDIEENPLVKGLTICGGDSFFSAKDMVDFVNLYREKFGESKTIWVYTGFTWEEILKENDINKLEYLKHIDVLVDGRFNIEERDVTLKYRGSKNQRLINVPESLKQNKVVLLDLD